MSFAGYLLLAQNKFGKSSLSQTSSGSESII